MLTTYVDTDGIAFSGNGSIDDVRLTSAEARELARDLIMSADYADATGGIA